MSFDMKFEVINNIKKNVKSKANNNVWNNVNDNMSTRVRDNLVTVKDVVWSRVWIQNLGTRFYDLPSDKLVKIYDKITV